MQSELDKAKEIATKLKKRREEVALFHQTRQISQKTPAIPEEFLDNLFANADLNSEKKTPKLELTKAKTLVSIINNVVAKRSETLSLVDARLWRLTMDRQTIDSDRKPDIYNHYEYLENVLLPSLQKAGIVHSILEQKDIKELGLRYDHYLGQHDLLVQF